MLPPVVVRLKYRQYSVSQEQTFIPKVQVYFADFPYSHCSTKLEVISFGDLLRFLVRFMVLGVKNIRSIQFSSVYSNCFTGYKTLQFRTNKPIAEQFNSGLIKSA